MKARGGKRPNVGRKSTLPLKERFIVCARHESERAALAMKRAMDKHKEALPYADIEKSRAALRSIPPKDRKQLSQQAQEDLTWLRDTLDGHRIVIPRRPQGERDALIRRIAKEESSKRCVTITPRMIKRWLLEYRRFCQD